MRNLIMGRRQVLSMSQVLVTLSIMLDGGYSALYDNKIPADIKYIDYDRNVKHIGKAEHIIIRIFTYVF